jgi:hypothetical protein
LIEPIQHRDYGRISVFAQQQRKIPATFDQTGLPVLLAVQQEQETPGPPMIDRNDNHKAVRIFN